MYKKAKNILRNYLNYKVSSQYNKQYKVLLKRNNIANVPCQGEDKWVEKWSVLGKANPVYYRLFSHYIGSDLNIIPEDICHNVIELFLNPKIHVPYYSDKNMFDKLFKKGTMPVTIFRKIDGFFYDENYSDLTINDDKKLYYILEKSGYDKIVIKPSVDSCSGNDVRLFFQDGKTWKELGSEEQLSIEYLSKNYGDNYIVQECLKQADCMAYYNPTSINTIRVTLYRSVKDNKCCTPSAIIRIGAKGSFVDNAHAGGAFVGIYQDGSLCKKVLNQYGESTSVFNDIDFSQEHKIPNWDKVIEFAKYIGENVPHHRLLALDIMIDSQSNPKLVEFNCDGYSMWLFQFTCGAALGEYADEVIEYCKNNLNKCVRSIRI